MFRVNIIIYYDIIFTHLYIDIEEDAEIIEMQAVINQLRAEHRKLLNELQRLVKEHKKENGLPISTAGRKPGRQPNKIKNNNINSNSITSTSNINSNSILNANNTLNNNNSNIPAENKISIYEQTSIEYGYKDKERLSNKINRLSTEDSQKLVDIIANSTEYQRNGEVEIDLEALSDDTLRTLEIFANKCLKKQDAKVARREKRTRSKHKKEKNGGLSDSGSDFPEDEDLQLDD